jgi:hypothetical protein
MVHSSASAGVVSSEILGRFKASRVLLPLFFAFNLGGPSATKFYIINSKREG